MKILSLFAALVAAAVVVGGSGAVTAKERGVAKIDVSTRSAVIHYLRSIHLNPRGVVIQRGARNYAGPNCPGKRWRCASTKRTVVQIARRGGKNVFRCARARCAVLQISKSALAKNAGTCIKTTGVTQSCTISQPNATGTNKAVVWMDTGKLTGLTQTVLYTASISQGPASPTGSSNTNLACVHQLISVDGSTKNPTSSSTTVTTEAHQSISIDQNSLTGANTVQNATNVGSAYDCEAAPLSQDQTLYSLATSKGPVTQKQNAAPNGPNLNLDIKQNQGSGFFGNATGANDASFKQTNTLIAIANSPAGATQIQSSDTTGGILAAVNQDSRGKSTASAVQEEFQCEDAAPSGLSQCDTVADAPANYPLTQKQYGPAGLVKSAIIRHGRHFQLRKAPGDSFQTGNAANTFLVNQTSRQYNDTKNDQKNLVIGGITTSGTGTVNQETFIADKHKVDVQQGENATVNGTIDCPNGGTSCTKTLSPPKITSTPADPSAYGTAASFSFSNVDPTVDFVCSLDGATPYTTCSSAQSYGTDLPSGSHTFSVKTRDPDNGLVSAAASFSWVITPPTPTITSNPPNPSDSSDATFEFTDTDPSVLFQCQLDDGAYELCTSPQPYTGLGDGDHTFNVKATDQSATYESGVATYTWTIALVVIP